MPLIQKLRIKCTAAEISTLTKVYGVTQSTVYNALNYRNNSETSKAIRAHAEKIFGHTPFLEEITV